MNEAKNENRELIKAFEKTWSALEAYDNGTLPATGAVQKDIECTAHELKEAISELKENLREKQEATELFAKEKENGSFEGIVENIFQSFGGKELYPTIEEKAAHLLYFVVKNHVFIDGNKRSGAFSFVWFLRKAGMLDLKSLTPAALTVLTLLIAESDPKKKEQMTALVTQLLR